MKLTASQKSILLELCLVWCLAIGGARLFYMLRGVPFIRENLLFFTSSLLLYLPAWALWRQKESIDFFERNFSDCLRSLKIFLIFCLILTPLIFGVNHFYQKIVFQAQYYPHSNSSLWKILFFQIFLVALPEEFFFRGYFLKRMRSLFQDQFTFLGVKMGYAFFLTALIFALSHSLIVVRWWHFTIFFPALAFGWLREKTGFLSAGILFHALSNVFSAWAVLHYR